MSFLSPRSVVVVVVVAGLALASPAASAPNVRLVIRTLGLSVPIATRLSDGPVIFYRDHDTIAIAGHRTTYTHPFRNLPRLRRGDHIRLGRRTFIVRRELVVRPHDTWVLNYRGLVLSACHPAGSAEFRYVIFAADAAREPQGRT